MNDFSVTVAMTCPTCGYTEFAYEESASSQSYTDDWPFECAHCGRTFTYAQILEGNAEAVDAAINDMGDEVVDSLSKDLAKTLKAQGWDVR